MAAIETTTSMIARGCKLVLFLGVLGIAIATNVPAQSKPSPLEGKALKALEDIVPRTELDFPFLKIEHDDCHGYVGKIFGTDQVGALVAVNPPVSRSAKAAQEADLCLLLWKDGWSFAQNVGKVEAFRDEYPPMDWHIKRHPKSHTVYVLSHLQLYPVRKHDSWVCDRETLRLKPTGWPKDAIASLSGDTITFTRAERPGYTPLVRTIHAFGPDVKAAIATISTTYDAQHLPTTTLEMTPRGKSAATWIIRPKDRSYDPGHATYAVCRHDPADSKAPFEEHASIEFNWGDNYADGSAAMFVFHRLTGLGSEAYSGTWDEDETRPLRTPISAKVSGLPEAVDLFSLEAAEQQGTK